MVDDDDDEAWTDDRDDRDVLETSTGESGRCGDVEGLMTSRRRALLFHAAMGAEETRRRVVKGNTARTVT